MLEETEIFPWSESFETGIEQIDRQHRELVDLLNVLVTGLAFKTDALSASAIFQRLADYTVEHFRTEEECWKDVLAGDAWELEHRQEHVEFIARMQQMQAASGRPLEEVIQDVVAFLTPWLAMHILDSDKRLAKVVLALRSGMTLELAKATATQQMRDSVRGMVDTVMLMYDKITTQTMKLNREIQRRRQVESQLQQAHESLQSALAAAEGANRAKSGFLANLSHEIRTPMSVITGMAHLLKREGLNERQTERVQEIDHASQILLALINDILDLSKIEAGKLSIEEAPLNVRELVETVVSMLEDEAQAKGLALKVEMVELPQRLIGDSTRIKQALLNYIKNAVKFTDIGGVTIKVALLDESDAHATLRFNVIDTGIGLTEEVRTRLFCAYEQADIMTARLYGGTGLGLAITRKLVELMDGQTGVSSLPGQGSDFWFTVRLRKSDQDPAQLEATDDQRADEALKREFAGASVLLVEDNRVSREIASTILRNVDIDVEMANDGIEAVESAKRGRFALILMDVQMPRLDGLQATRAIRRLDHVSNTPILAMTANAYLDDKVRCLEAGMDDVITKPFDPDVLYRVLLRWLRTKRTAR